MIAHFHKAAERELAAAMEVGERRGSGLGVDRAAPQLPR
jgi:hypothetical protein